MKKIVCMTAGVLAMGTVIASAADLPARMPVKAPPMATVYNWTGCYLGGYGGGAFGARNVNVTDPQSQGGAFPAGTFYNAPNASVANGGLYNYGLGSSAIGGGTIGCNWQTAGSPFVLGAEADGGYMRLTKSVVVPYSIAGQGSDTTDTTTIGSGTGTLTGRLGWAYDRVLFYAKAGVGFARLGASTNDSCSAAPCGPGTLASASSRTDAFWVAGGGIEWAVTNNWSVKGEYMFLGIRETLSVCGIGGGAAAGSTYCGAHSVDGVHTAKIGLNYHFNYGAPVAAAY